MHELSVCLSILQQVEAIAGERGARRASRIEISIGPLSGVEPDLLQNAWPLAVAGSIADQAELAITETGVVVRCTSCHAESPARANRLACPVCKDFRTQVIQGDEMILQRVELETS